ncbi:aspartate/glutamate racemase family protein [Alsobacter sp. SYSU M60028]|uniref:Aspartate/glutamate racemase family protein n=1 Tax=Alsobacter ponti TaxID=2962936 RepID=A0ABT1L6Z7_9HYPH|nr:aspartate/glutamate racemase family protein [Alsobacter ponti]MCP8937212.1 aspartate/glutamate racemase family protein [Alsobacter ponti]
MRTIGLIGGMSWESTAIYYRLVNEAVRARLGGLHSARVLLWSFDFDDIARMQTAGDWDAAGAALAGAARGLRDGGAEALVLCTNTMHKVADAIAGAVDLPFIHLADVTAAAIRRAGCRKPLLLATRYTMEDDFYVGRLRDRHGIEAITPDAEGRALTHSIIYDELCRGIVRDASREALLGVVAAARARGADGVILGCTELGMILDRTCCAEPVFDTTRLHAEAAVDFSLAA